MNLIEIANAYDQLKLAQKELNACLADDQPTPNRSAIAAALANLACAQDMLLRFREACLRREFTDSARREQRASSADHNMPYVPCRTRTH